MAQHEPQEGEQNDAIDEKREVARALEALGGRGGVGEDEERGEGVAHFLQREGKVRAEEREEEVCGESEERGEEKHAQGRDAVDGPAQPDARILDVGHRGLGPTDEGGFRAGWQRDNDGWKDGRIGVTVLS
ncbi:hypothetical protein B0H13DRAFT_1904062 [Mycena leptocephala]|nr:hypothetical protein B0H13DRAFT_1904062 [Mycena leptocephala]